MSSLYSEQEELLKEYIETVLIHLFPGISYSEICSYSYDYGPNDFNFVASFDTIVKFIPGYAVNSNSFVHFTSLQKLFSILQEQSIRLYCSQQMNDTQEIRHTFEGIKSNLDPSWERNLEILQQKTYIFSMCEAQILEGSNALNLWRLYGDNASGCGIELEVDNLYSIINPMFIARCSYSDLNYSKFIQCNEIFLQTKGTKNFDYMRFFHLIACLNKNKIFEIENETRIICRQTANEVCDLFSTRSYWGYDFKASLGYVPYRKLRLWDFENNQLILKIKKIHLGPKCDSILVNRLNSFLSDYIFALKNHRREDVKNGYFYNGRLVQSSDKEKQSILSLIDKIKTPVVELSNLHGLYA